jgi:hypothetical protein
VPAPKKPKPVTDDRHVHQADLESLSPLTPTDQAKLDHVYEESGMPTRKWWAAFVTGLGAWFVAFIEAGWEFTDTLAIVLVGFVVERAVAWLTPNDPTPGGVPDKG